MCDKSKFEFLNVFESCVFEFFVSGVEFSGVYLCVYCGL